MLSRWPNTYLACVTLYAPTSIIFRDVHDGFKINTTGTYRISRMNLGLGKHGKHIAFKLQDMPYLDNIMSIIVNQLKRYNNAESDVMTYAMSAMASNDYIELLPTYRRNILYPQLYKELKNLTMM